MVEGQQQTYPENAEDFKVPELLREIQKANREKSKREKSNFVIETKIDEEKKRDREEDPEDLKVPALLRKLQKIEREKAELDALDQKMIKKFELIEDFIDREIDDNSGVIEPLPTEPQNKPAVKIGLFINEKYEDYYYD